MSLNKKLFSKSSGITLFALFFTATSAFSVTEIEQQIIDRIKPAGQVCIQGENCAVAVAAASSAASGEPRSGEAIYNSACVTCHATGLAGAPTFGDAAAWAPKIEKGFDTMLTNAINGINAMPPKGTCMNCSEDEMRSVIEYMIDAVQ